MSAVDDAGLCGIGMDIRGRGYDFQSEAGRTQETEFHIVCGNVRGLAVEEKAIQGGITL